MNSLKLTYEVDGEDFTRAGEASSNVKKQLRKLGISPEAIRKVAIALYEGEINMVIHADGGNIDVEITPEKISMVLKDQGKGIADIDKAMQEGYSTAPDEVRKMCIRDRHRTFCGVCGPSSKNPKATITAVMGRTGLTGQL